MIRFSFMHTSESGILWQRRTIVPASLSRLFAPFLQFELEQKSWLSLLVKLCGAALFLRKEL